MAGKKRSNAASGRQSSNGPGRAPSGSPRPVQVGARSEDRDPSEVVVLKPGRDKAIRQRHPWIFSGAIRRLPQGAADGALVDVVDRHGAWLARGFLNRTSQIQVRILTWDEDDAMDAAFWRRRLEAAMARRRHLNHAGTSAYRLVNAENDNLPGLMVDRYGDYLVVQIGVLGMEQRKEMLADLLLSLTGCRGVVERSDMALRKQEGLHETGGLLAGEVPPGLVEIQEHGAAFFVDLLEGQKTGFYTDQRANRQRVAAYCAGAQVLNGFSYTGAFAIHALRSGATRVVNLDASADALALAERNVAMNGFVPAACLESVEGDAFQILREWRDAGRSPFDVVILDPPKFAHNRQSVERALRGYKDINMLALQLVRAEGILATFSCSGLVDPALFQKVLFGAALDAGRDVQILEWLHQSSDHPVSIHFPEGAYLKGFICHVS